MLTHSDSVYIRYLFLLNGLAAFAPAMLVKGRANDPLRQTNWWTFDQHSAVFVVIVAAVIGTLLVYWLIRRDIRSWWTCAFAGTFTGILPALLYLVAAPLNDDLIVTIVAMLIVGIVSGTPVGLLTYFVVARKRNSNLRRSGP